MASYDLIIIGGGTSGMTSAIRAAELGLSCAVIEKDDKVGGTLFWSGGHMCGGGTQLQKRKGIEDSIDEHYKDIVTINGGTGDLALIRKAVELGPKTIDWLEDNGLEFAPEAPRIIYGHIPYTKPRTHYGVNKAMSIYNVIKPMWDEHLASGQIRVYLKSVCDRFIAHDGRYQECVVTDHLGQTQTIKGDHIFMSTGGYGSNPTFFKEKHPGIPLCSSTYPTATGDGHIMLETDYNAQFRLAGHHLPSLGGIEDVPGSGRCDMNALWAMVLTSAYRHPREIYLNTNGERFMNEDEINADVRERAVMQQPGCCLWMVFDEAALMHHEANGAYNPLIIGWTVEKIKEKCATGGSFLTADTIPDLAVKAGLPAKHVQHSVNTWNDYVDNGHDPDFQNDYCQHKISKGPFYAIKTHASVLVTFGGIATDTNHRVLDKNGEVIQGLYAAGELAGMGAVSGGAFCSGMAITPALAFGRDMAELIAR